MASGDLWSLLAILKRHDVPFIIIGGHAVAAHGFLRATEDLDIVVQRSPERDARLFAALSEVHAQWIGNEIDPTTGIERTIPVTLAYVRSTHLMMLVTDFGFLDVFDYLPGFPSEPVEQLFESAVEFGGWRYASLEWLRRLKHASDRPKDRIDLENLPTSQRDES